MPKRPTLDAIAPPPREKPAVPATNAVRDDDLVPVCIRIPANQAKYLRMLSASTGTPQQDLVKRALELLRKDAGEI